MSSPSTQQAGSMACPHSPNLLQSLETPSSWANYPHQAITKLYKTYRPFKTLKLGSITTIVISSQNIAKEALQNYDQALSSRTIPKMPQIFDHHKVSMGVVAHKF